MISFSIFNIRVNFVDSGFEYVREDISVEILVLFFKW